MNVILLRSLMTVSLISLSAGAYSQEADESALDEFDKRTPAAPLMREPAGAVELRSAMRRIAQQPTDADALADAGNAALTLGDANAALNFFTRAHAVRPRDGRITSGLAAATVRTENPFEALRLFDDAVRLGVSERSIASDRALAFDLLGNFGRAQQDYKLARSASVSDDLIVRQAISLSLSGQKQEADGMLIPLLQKNNPSAWRARAFMLAARGEIRESTKVTQGFMDVRSAQKMERYLRLMPDLTGAQQAAAIHLGHFPANNIGRDSSEIKRVAASIPASQPAKNESRLIPSGEPLGQKPANEKSLKRDRKAEKKREREAKAEASKLPKVVKASNPVSTGQAQKDSLATDAARARVAEAKLATMAVAKAGALPPPESARPLVKVALPSASDARPVAQAATILNSGSGGPSPTVLATPVKTETVTAAAIVQKSPAPAITASDISKPVIQTAAVQGPSQSGAPTTTTPTSTIPVTAVAAEISSTPPPPSTVRRPPFDLAAIVGSIEIPESEQKQSAVPVDLKKLKPAAPKLAVVDTGKTVKVDPKIKQKTAVPVHPARFWVQIAAGEASALGYDYRKWQKKSTDLFKGKDGWTSAWGKTTRLLVGPFDDLKTSKKWEADFRKAGGNGFTWKSENGVVVNALKGK